MNIQNKYISTKCIELEGLIKDSGDWAEEDAKLGAHLATYINVLILGILEDCIEYLVKERSKKAGDAEVENYISKDIEQRLRNPDYKKICGVLGQFSSRYKAEFQNEFSVDCLEVDALDSIMRNKTNVAHFGLANLGLTVKDVEHYFHSVVRMLEKLEDLLLINP